RAYCGERLPGGMVPGRFVGMSELPRTISGKVDRRALPVPEEGEGEYEAPRTAVEQVLASLWQQQLGLVRVGLRDHFFQLGGHSLMAAQLVSRIRTAFQVEIALRTLFEKPTLEGLAREIEKAREAEEGVQVPAMRRADRSEGIPLSYAQQRLWFLDQLEPGQAAYNMPVALEMTGELEVEVLRGAFAEMVQRHESLRTLFVEKNGTAWQEIEAGGKFELPVEDVSGEEEGERRAREELERECRRPFDLERGPLLRCRLWKLEEKRHWLLCHMHHIISGGRSLGGLIP